MSRRRCDCNGPVVVSAFGAGVQRCEDLGVTLPPPLPQSDAAHDACFWPYGARNQKEYDAKVASNELLQMGPYERAALRECMPRIRGLDDYQLKLRLLSYYGTDAYRYAAAGCRPGSPDVPDGRAGAVRRRRGGRARRRAPSPPREGARRRAAAETTTARRRAAAAAAGPATVSPTGPTSPTTRRSTL